MLRVNYSAGGIWVLLFFIIFCTLHLSGSQKTHLLCSRSHVSEIFSEEMVIMQSLVSYLFNSRKGWHVPLVDHGFSLSSCTNVIKTHSAFDSQNKLLLIHPQRMYSKCTVSMLSAEHILVNKTLAIFSNKMYHTDILWIVWVKQLYGKP